MSTISQFSGSSSVTSLPCGFSTGYSSLNMAPSISTASGAMTSGVLKTFLEVTGSKSRLNGLFFSAADATSRNVRFVVTIDGTAVFDNTLTGLADTNARIVVGNGITAVLQVVIFQPVDANTSLKIEASSSLSETDKLNIYYNYEVRR